MLHWFAPIKYLNSKATKIMNEPVVCVRLKEDVAYIVNILTNTTHNGFPVVDEVDEVSSFDKSIGIQILILAI